MDNNKIKGALWGAFCADAYSLGPHWEYNTKNIEDASLNWEGFNDPITSYHGDKKAGDFTHYGDQAMWLLESIGENGSFDLSLFGKKWMNRMENYGGYIDHASSDTLVNLKKGIDWNSCGSDSNDFSAVGRAVSLLLVEAENPEELRKSFRDQTALTHNNEIVLESAAFFADLAVLLLKGEELVSGLNILAKDYSPKIGEWVENGLSSAGKKKTSLVIKKFGQACSIDHGFPGVIHLIAKYTDDYRQAMEENAKSGGDSAARGMPAGMILGIINGEQAVPAEWKKSLNAHEEILKIIETI